MFKWSTLEGQVAGVGRSGSLLASHTNCYAVTILMTMATVAYTVPSLPYAASRDQCSLVCRLPFQAGTQLPASVTSDLCSRIFRCAYELWMVFHIMCD